MIVVLNTLLCKTKFSITERLDIADLMVGYEYDLTYSDWLDLLDKNSTKLYIQSKRKRLYMRIEDNLCELFFIDRLERHDYFKLLELCSNPVKVVLTNIQEYSHTQIDSYFGVSANIEALEYSTMEHDIFYIDPLEYVHDPINDNIHKIEHLSIIEERKDYIYFKINNTSFEARELVGSFDLYCGSQKISTAANKNDVLKQAKSYLDIIQNQN